MCFAGFEYRGDVIDKDYGSLLDVECGSQLMASRETGTTVLQPLGTELCQRPKSAWKWVIPKRLQMRA